MEKTTVVNFQKPWKLITLEMRLHRSRLSSQRRGLCSRITTESGDWELMQRGRCQVWFFQRSIPFFLTFFVTRFM